jgi:hypothetical protein
MAFTCTDANENYATGRVMGSSHLAFSELTEHAITCDQWPPHALPARWWDGVERERTRRRNFAAWKRGAGK